MFYAKVIILQGSFFLFIISNSFGKNSVNRIYFELIREKNSIAKCLWKNSKKRKKEKKSKKERKKIFIAKYNFILGNSDEFRQCCSELTLIALQSVLILK